MTKSRSVWVALLLLIPGCASPAPIPTPTPASTRTPTPITEHQTYTFRANAGDWVGKQWHAGDVLTLKWTAFPDKVVTDVKPLSVTLAMSLVGPFDRDPETLDAITERGDPASPNSEIVIDNWTSQVAPQEVRLPSDEAHGAGIYVAWEAILVHGSSNENFFTNINVVK